MTAIRRGDLTNHLIQSLTAANLLIGDGQAPDDGGWDDDPNAPSSSYSPYVVILPQTAAGGEGSFGDSMSEWLVPYIFISYGLTRAQVEWAADEARLTFTATALDTVNMAGETWQITQPKVDSIGGIARNDNMEPSEFSQTDLVSLRISKEI